MASVPALLECLRKVKAELCTLPCVADAHLHRVSRPPETPKTDRAPGRVPGCLQESRGDRGEKLR